MQQNKFYGLDHLRTLAILLVFLFHYQLFLFGHPGWLPDVAHMGWSGVDLFFVLSGFLISSQLFARIRESGSLSLKDFFIKRFFRILPAFWFTLALYFCVAAFRERDQLRPIWTYLTFTQNFGLDVANFGTFSHAWSLCVEEHFYLLLPFLLLFLMSIKIFRKAYWLIILLFAATVFARYYSYTRIYETAPEHVRGISWYMYIYYPSYCRLDSLLVGVGIAAAYVYLPAAWTRMSKYGNLVFVLALLVLTAAWFICYDQQAYYSSVFGFSVVAIGYGLMVIAALSPSCFLYKWKSRVTTLIATLSYGIYLTHKGVVHLTQLWFTGKGLDINSNLCLFVCIITSIIAAGILYLLIERPFMNLRKRILKSNANT